MLVWVAYQLAGAPAAMARFGLPRRTVYNHLERVEGDEALLATARKLLDERRTAALETVDAMHLAATEAFTARIHAGEVTNRQLLLLLLGGRAPTRGGPGGSPGGSALEVPRFLTTPREGS